MDYAVLQIDLKSGNTGDTCDILIGNGGDVARKYNNSGRVRIPDDTYDDYGFCSSVEKEIIDNNPKVEYRMYRASLNSIKAKDVLRIEKFVSMIKVSHYGKLHRKFQNRVRKGTPNSIRGQVWLILMPGNELNEKHTGVYKSLCVQLGVHNTMTQIDKDVNRSYREHVLFQDRYSPHQCKLFRLLKAYSIYNPEVGYCQGMSSVATTLLMYLDEEIAFWSFVHLMSNSIHRFSDMFLPGFPKMFESCYILTGLVRHHLPKFHKHLVVKLTGELTTDLYACRWFLTCLNGSLPFEISIHILDMIISEGYDFIFVAIVSLLKMMEKEFLQLNDFGAVKMAMQDLDHRALDFKYYLSTIASCKVSKKRIASLRLAHQKLAKNK